MSIHNRRFCIKLVTANNMLSLFLCFSFMNDTSYTSEFKMSVTACYGTKDYVKYLEHTQIELELSCSNISEISINLISPRRTKVSLLTKVNTSRVAYTNLQWTFMTVHFWGEDPEGVWRLNLVANSIQNGKKFTVMYL